MKISMIPNKIVKLIHASKGDTSLRKWAFEPYDNNGAISVSNIKPQLVYKTENGGTEQLLPVNTSTPTTSYFDGTINYGTDTDVEFTYKQSSYTGQARIKSIKGNTLVWNQLVKNARKSVTGSGITFTNNNDGTWKLTGTATADVTYGVDVSGDRVNVVQGHKYYLRGCPSGGDDAKYYLELQGYARDKGTGVVFTAQSSSADVSVTLTVKNGVDLGTGITFTPQVFDLTLNETNNLDTFTSLFPLPKYAYGQYLLNFNGTGIKTTGKNLVFKVLQSANIGGDGSIVADNQNLYDLAVAEVVGGKQYHIGNNRLDSAIIGWFTSEPQIGSRTYDGQRIVGSSLIPTAPITGYIVFRIDKPFAKPTFNLGTGNIDYEPYTSSTLSLPITTYFPTGMKSAGSVYDELSDKAITRVGSVDLGSLTWGYVSSNGCMFSEGIKTLVKIVAGNVLSNLLCPKYDSKTYFQVISSTQGISISTNGNIFVYDPSYTDATTFKSAMSGVYLNYELATYTETDIQNASLVCKDIETPCYLSSGNLVCDATEELTNESGFFDAKLKLKDSSGVAYSSKFKLHVEDL